MEYREFLFTHTTGKRHFTLSEDSISISRTGKRPYVTLLLQGLEPEYRTVRQRTPAFWAGLVLLCLGLTVAATMPIVDSDNSYSLKAHIAIREDGMKPGIFLFDLGVLLAIGGALISFAGLRKVEHAIFKNTTGVDALSIARAGPDSQDFNHFVDEISRRIRQVRSEQPENES